jgi:hypothetical protein
MATAPRRPTGAKPVRKKGTRTTASIPKFTGNMPGNKGGRKPVSPTGTKPVRNKKAFAGKPALRKNMGRR